MFVLASGFKSATYIVSDETITSISSEVNVEKLNQVKNIEYSSDVDFKKALKEVLGTSEASKLESEILPKAIRLNSVLILTAILAFVASFAVSLGPVMWVLFSELFPNTVRAIAISFVDFINSVISFLVQLVFPWEISNLGSAPTFFIYGVFAALGLIFIILRVPETKGKTLEELQLQLIKK
jgi:MFS family permease